MTAMTAMPEARYGAPLLAWGLRARPVRPVAPLPVRGRRLLAPRPPNRRECPGSAESGVRTGHRKYTAKRVAR
eukprot:2232683-Rhodomonas_salina.1